MKKLLCISTLAALVSLCACRKEDNENVVKPASMPATASTAMSTEEDAPGEVGTAEKGYLFGQPIEYARINGKAVFQGDIVLTEAQLTQNPPPVGDKNGRVEGAGRTGGRWSNNTVYFTIASTLSNQARVTSATRVDIHRSFFMAQGFRVEIFG